MDKYTSLFKKIIISLLLLLIVNIKMEGNIYKFDKLLYGSHINEIYLKNINKKEIVIPQEDKVTILFFFNINNMSHNNILNQLNFIIINLNYENKDAKLIAISKGDKKEFKKNILQI